MNTLYLCPPSSADNHVIRSILNRQNGEYLLTSSLKEAQDYLAKDVQGVVLAGNIFGGKSSIFPSETDYLDFLTQMDERRVPVILVQRSSRTLPREGRGLDFIVEFDGEKTINKAARNVNKILSQERKKHPLYGRRTPKEEDLLSEIGGRDMGTKEHRHRRSTSPHDFYLITLLR